MVEKYKTICSNNGFVYVTKTNISTKTLIHMKCTFDGDITIVASSDLLRGKFACGTCKISKYKEALDAKGCRFIQKCKVNGKTFIEYTDESNEIKRASISNVLAGRFLPAKEDTKWNVRTYVYRFSFFDNGNEYFKIGFSSSPEKRLRQLNLTKLVCVDVLADCDTTYMASSIETMLHRENKKYSISPTIAESFTNGFENIKDENGVRCIKRKHGITEWFLRKKQNDI